MTRMWRWFLAVALSLMVTLGGLFADAVIHMQEHDQGVHESLLTGNPAHLVFGLGLVMATVFALAGFSISWSAERAQGAAPFRLALPALLWLIAGLAGVMTLIVMSRTG